MDALSDVLRAVRLTGAFFFDVHACAPWCAETPLGKTVVDAMFPGSDHLICYHLLMEGSCWATLEGEEPIKLVAGDIIVLPQGDTHVLATDARHAQVARDVDVPQAEATASCRRRSRWAATAARPRISSAAFSAATRVLTTRCSRRCRASSSSMITAAARWARTFARRSPSRRASAWAARICWAASASSCSSTSCGDISRSLPADRTNWLSGLRDQYVGRALMALHANPARDWTLEALAQEAALSRSAFAERFTQFVGHPPMQYLTNWRMQLATNYLRNGTESVAAIANRVGYESEAAFSRAFKKVVGAPPSEWREQRLTGNAA